MAEKIDIDHLRTWIGKQDSERDSITPELVKRFQATLGGHTQPSSKFASQNPLGIHWCLALSALSREDLGADGHPAKGGFLPPVPLPRRMWASSRIRFHKPPAVGVAIQRTSTIADVVFKKSATAGPLVFVHVDHVYSQETGQDDETLIEDRQIIVYRQASNYQEPRSSQHQNFKTPASTVNLTPDSTLLFRYSALTFNGHRIHYDHNYTTSEEGYPALVVHGPLMATLLMNLAQANRPNEPMREFEFRGLAPAFVDNALQLEIMDESAEALEARNHEGALIMTASAKFASTNENQTI